MGVTINENHQRRIYSTLKHKARIFFSDSLKPSTEKFFWLQHINRCSNFSDEATFIKCERFQNDASRFREPWLEAFIHCTFIPLEKLS